jgi:predicted nucleotide-binding protein
VDDLGPEAIQARLVAENIEFSAKEMLHGRQFRFPDGAVLNSYNSGRTQWQGKKTDTTDKVSALLEQHLEKASVLSKTQPETQILSSNKVFIVYGHDVECREQLELLLRRMRLEPVILQNLVGGGDTIIEKLEANLDVHYACALLTPDDEGYPANKPEEVRKRARQNVVLELGMFLVRLGRKRVAILHKGDIELPSDINGLIYIRFEKRVDEIKDRVAAELQDAGFQINIKDLLS